MMLTYGGHVLPSNLKQEVLDLHSTEEEQEILPLLKEKIKSINGILYEGESYIAQFMLLWIDDSDTDVTELSPIERERYLYSMIAQDILLTDTEGRLQFAKDLIKYVREYEDGLISWEKDMEDRIFQNAIRMFDLTAAMWYPYY